MSALRSAMMRLLLFSAGRSSLKSDLMDAAMDLDPAANRATVGIDGSIAAPTSRVALEVIRVDEASILAAEAAALVGRAA